MKKFTIPCIFGGRKSPFAIYIGEPEPLHHPVHFQNEWLSKHRNGTIPPEIMDSIAKLHELAKKNNVSLEDLCVYALSQDEEEEASDSKNKEESLH